MKKFGWTLIELTVCFVVMAILVTAITTNIKPSESKQKMFFYASLNVLLQGISDIKGSIADDATGKFCLQLTDYFTLKSVDCTKSANTDVSLTFPNKSILYGLGQAWKTSTDSYKYIDVLYDMNGKLKPNTLGIDRMPFRIYDDQVGEIVSPVDCSASADKSAYCNKIADNSAASTENFLTSTQLISYDIFRRDSEDKASIIASAQPYAKAHCLANGGNEIINGATCVSKYGTSILPQCITSTTCYEACAESPSYAVCPTSHRGKATCSNKVQTSNPNDYECFVLLHKPSAPGAMFFTPIIDSIVE